MSGEIRILELPEHHIKAILQIIDELKNPPPHVEVSETNKRILNSLSDLIHRQVNID